MIENYEMFLVASGKSKNTINTYVSQINLLWTELKGLLGLSSGEINDYFDSLDCSQSTKRLRYSSLCSFYKYCIKDGLLDDYPMADVDPPDMPVYKMPLYLSKSKIKELTTISGKDSIQKIRDKVIISAIYYTGGRIGEVSQLRVKDINFQEQEVFIRGKGGKSRFVCLNVKLIPLLKLWLEYREVIAKPECCHLWVSMGKNHRGEVLSYGSFRQVIRSVFKSHKIEANPYILRHSFATHMLHDGVNPATISEILGHSDLSTLNVYAHPNHQDQRSVINIL